MTSKYIKSPKNRVHFIENIHLALMFLKKESEFDTSNYGTEGLYSTLIYNFSLLIRLFSQILLMAISSLSQDSAGVYLESSVHPEKKAPKVRYNLFLIIKRDSYLFIGKPFEDSLLQWLRNTLQEYELPIGDFTTSFEDGRVFCALMDKYDSSFLDYSSVEAKNKVENNELAFTTAEQKLSIPQLLDPAKVAGGKADERSIVLYVSLIQQAFVRKFAELESDQEKKGFASKLEELKFELEKSNKEKEEYRLANENLEAKILELEETIKGQKSELEDWESKYLELMKENDQLKKENEEQKKKIQHLEERVKTLEELMSAESSEKYEIDAMRRNLESEIEKLRKEKRDLEEEAEELRQERDQLLNEHKDMIESRDKFKQAQMKLEAEYEAQSQLQLNALAELRKNLIEHVNDMNIWKGYLEQDREYLSETIYSLTEKTIIDSSFEDQLEYLAKSLSTENSKLQQLLKERELEEESKKSEQKSKAKEEESGEKSKKKKAKA